MSDYVIGNGAGTRHPAFAVNGIEILYLTYRHESNLASVEGKSTVFYSGMDDLKTLLTECGECLQKWCSSAGHGDVDAKKVSASLIERIEQVCLGHDEDTDTERRLRFFSDSLDEMLSYQASENKLSNVEVIGSLFLKILEAWDEMKASVEEEQD